MGTKEKQNPDGQNVPEARLTKEGQAASPNVLNSIHKITLAQYITVLVDKDFSPLILAGNPSQAELDSAFESIKTEYNDVIGGGMQKDVVSKVAVIQRLKLRYNKCQILIAALKMFYVEVFAEELSTSLCVNLKWNYTDREEYEEDISKCERVMGSIHFKIQVKEMQIEAIYKQMPQSTFEPNRDDFMRTLITLSDHAGRELDDSIILFAYAERVKRFNSQAERRIEEKQRQAQSQPRRVPWLP